MVGYPPHDLLDRPEMLSRSAAVLEHLCALTVNKQTALVVGAPLPFDGDGRSCRNSILIFENGKRVFEQDKQLLPTYDVFDEARYFEPGHGIQLWECEGQKIGFAICEDLWARDPILGRKLYGKDPVDQLIALKPDLVISISASPFTMEKRKRREALHASLAKEIGAPLLYLNQVGATDEILFDGGSFAVSKLGVFQGRLPLFKEASGLLDFDGARLSWVESHPAPTTDEPDEIAVVHDGLVLGIQEYFKKTGFQRAVLGLSGGIDSAVVACLAVQALGREAVLGVAMPSQYSSSHSLEDAEHLARNLGIAFEVQPIKFAFSVLGRELGKARGGELSDIASENLQSRLRGLTLMTYANHLNALCLTTGNKSELATGYCTQYGDMVGAIAPIGDLYKTKVYELAREINRRVGQGLIPERTLTKEPSAELRPDQKDSDSLPPYEVLDPFLEEYLEARKSPEELMKQYESSGEHWVKGLIQLVERNEFKRRQAAPVLKITRKAFGIGRRVPLAKRWG